MTVAVTGASGKTGQAVIRALRDSGTSTLALVRDASGYRGPGPAAAIDLDDGTGVRDALAGSHAVYLVAPNLHHDEPALVQRVLEAARRSGVRRLVYHSVAQPFAPAMPHHVDKARAEDLVRRSGLDWTVLQPCAYAQNLLGQLRAAAPSITVPYSPQAPFGLVDLADVAEAARVVLTTPGHGGATYELGGPEPVTVEDVARAASEVLARPVEAARAPWDPSGADRLQAEQRRRLLAMFDYYDTYGLLAGPGPLTWLLGRPPRDVRAVLARELTP